MGKRRKIGGQLGGRKPQSSGEDEVSTFSPLDDAPVDKDVTPPPSVAKRMKITSKKSSQKEETDGFFESPDDRRLRLAQEALDVLGKDLKEGESLSQRLCVETDVSAKKITYQIAKELTLGDPIFYKGHKLPPTCLAVGSDERFAFTGGKDCAIIQWDVETGQKIIFPGGRKRFECGGHFEKILGITVDVTSRLLCSVGEDELVRIWDCRAPGTKAVDSMRGHTKKITAICSDPEQNDMMTNVYTASEDKSIRLWSLASRRPVDTLYGHTRTPTCLDIAVSGRPVSGGEDQSVRQWKIETGTHLLFDRHTSPVDCVSSLTSQHCLSGEQSGAIALWSASHRKPLAWHPQAHEGHSICSLSCIRRADVAFSGSDDGFVRVWKTEGNAKGVSHVSVEEMYKIAADGFASASCVSRTGRHLFVALGKEHRLGRWVSHKSAKNGLLVVPLKHSAILS